MIGLSVLREIPVDVLPGILSGAYKAHGGVVRDAAGRIVSHLVTSGPSSLLTSLVPGVNTISSLAQSGQLHQLSRSVEALQASVQSVMNAAAAGAVLSGVGLAVNAAGFAYMHKRFEALSGSVDEVLRNLESHHLAVLKGAMQNLRHAEQADDPGTRKALLIDAKRDFQVSTHHYLERMKQSVGKDFFAALEDSYAVSFLGSSLSASELGLHPIAASDFFDHVESWRAVAREHVSQVLVTENPGKLLDPAMVQDLPAADAVDLLDFARDEQRGWGWVDEVRRRAAASSWWRPGGSTISRSNVLDAMRLRQRNEVLLSQAAHFKYLAERSLSARDFTRIAHDGLREAGVEAGYISAVAS